MSSKVQAEVATNVDPLCPHCSKVIRRVLLKEIESTLGVRYLYFCSECHKVMGISHRKGFWMG